MRARTAAALAPLAALLATLAVAGSAPASPVSPVDATKFDDPRPNAYFPLVPGTVLRYRGHEDGERFRERVAVTHRTKVIQGVTTTVVRDVVRRADGSVDERTHDWYAADNAGNVWYFGERTATYDEHGDVESRDGSWQAGVDGAVAGMIMPADPRPTAAYRQEYLRGEAEDQAWIVQRHVSTRVPHGRVRDGVRSLEWSRLEKDVVSEKVYGPGLGIVRERDLSGGDEVFTLVSVRRP